MCAVYARSNFAVTVGDTLHRELVAIGLLILISRLCFLSSTLRRRHRSQSSANDNSNEIAAFSELGSGRTFDREVAQYALVATEMPEHVRFNSQVVDPHESPARPSAISIFRPR